MERLISDLEKHSGKAGRVSRQGTIIPKYDVLAVCNACGDAHPTGISINLAGRKIRNHDCRSTTG
jgi:hypothetical protein